MKNPLYALAAFGTLSAASPVLAEEARVGYQDLDLATATGQQVLERRIEDAAEKVCGKDEQVVSPHFVPLGVKRCIAKATGNAREQMAMVVQNQGLGG